MTEIYLDENLSEYVADALNFLNKGYFQDCQVYSTKTKMGKGKPDEEIIPSIGYSNGIMITKDLNIHRTRLQYRLCEQYNIGIFFLKLPKGLDKTTGSDGFSRRTGRYGTKRVEARPGIEPGCEDLQSSTSPLRHRAKAGANARARRPCQPSRGCEATKTPTLLGVGRRAIYMIAACISVLHD